VAESVQRERRRLSARGKAAMAIVAPVVFLGLLEGGLQLAGYGRAREQPAAYDRFAARKAPGTVRVMVVGGSMAAGWPFHPRGGPARFLRELLRDVAPGQRTEVLNCAVNGLTSEGVLLLVRRLVSYEPDVLIVACGHNEFYNEPSFNRLIAGWDPEPPGWVSRTRTRLLLQDMATLLRGEPPEDGEEAVTRAQRAQAGQIAVPRDFKPGSLAAPLAGNLRQMIGLAREHGAAVILTTLPTNLRDAPPNKPEHRPDLTEEQREAWRRYYDEGRSLAREGQHEAALAAFAKADGVDATHAGLLYAQARSLLALGRYGPARELFVAARDQDFLPTRTTRWRNDAVRETAREADVALCDADRVFSDTAPHGIPGDELFCDHVHLTLDGVLLLARLWAEALDEHKLLGATTVWDWSRERSRDAYAKALGLTPSYLALAHCDVAFQCALAEASGVRVAAFRRRQLVESLRARGADHVAQALRLHPAAVQQLMEEFHPYIYCYVALGYVADGEPARAVGICKEVLDALPRFALAYGVLAEAQKACGDDAAADWALAELARLQEPKSGGDGTDAKSQPQEVTP